MKNLARGSEGAESSGVIKEILAFRLGGEEYGVNILNVQEIQGYNETTKIPGVPEFIKGVVNLRGNIVPIVDMRIKFGLEVAAYDQFTVVIILRVLGRTIGIVVDGVSDVLQLAASNIQDAPELGSSIDTEFIEGLATVADRMIILVDMEKMMSSRDMSLIDETRMAA